MARQPKFRKSNTLLPRLISAGVLIPVCLYLIYLGPPVSLVFGGCIAFGLFIEWISLLRKTKFFLLSKIIYGLIGTLYLGISCFWLFQNLNLEEGWRVFYVLFALVWSADTAAYVGGKLLKGPKLAPSLSPKKTWSGFICGILAGTTASYFLSLWLLPGILTLSGTFLLAVISQAGDLLESRAKRWGQVKDSSPLIPGHGGLLDRLDSLIAVSFTLALWQLF